MLKSIELGNGETYGYREAGEGDRTLILIHGNMTSSKHWDVAIDRLRDKFHIYAVDLRGFGASSYHREINSLKDFSEDIKLFIERLGLNKFSLAGWSTGGGVAMQFAADYPSFVEKLILVASVGIQGYALPKRNGMGRIIAGEFLTTKEEIANDPAIAPGLIALGNRDKVFYRNLWDSLIYTKYKPAPEQYAEYIEDSLTQRNLVDVFYALTHFNISPEFNGIDSGSGDVTRIQAPTLILQGDRDLVIPRISAEEIARDLPNSELFIVPDCGHSPLIDSLDILVDKIIEFLD
ncbi:alpha/beta hydrolase [Pannus brasiliensis CCIBt3594]|uniref:Alpha/beta hydrolase n=1 Tax=Pannus brasiliensis CCIBt3594 TaxID=1427578 RepID=A0AAW9QR04_9CHRO